MLPIHGFVLAGGRSSRMGVDKATLRLGDRTLLQLALEKLRQFCTDVSIAGGNLNALGELTPDQFPGQGPVAGVEAGLRASRQPWALFMPVDVPLVPPALLHSWAQQILQRGAADSGLRASCLSAAGHLQPAFCMLRQEAASDVQAALLADERRLSQVLRRVGGEGLAILAAEHLMPGNAEKIPVASQVELWFSNLNTPDDLAALQQTLVAAELHAREVRPK